MDFLFAIPMSIFHVIAWIINILLWPFKLVGGLLVGTGKFIISVFLAPFLLFSHPANVSAAQPAAPTVPAIANNRVEQIFNEIQWLELAGRQMEPLRTNNLALCVSKMREYQNQAENLAEITNNLPIKYKMTLGAAAISLNSCVSCLPSAQDSCKVVRMGLNEYQSMMSEE